MRVLYELPVPGMVTSATYNPCNGVMVAAVCTLPQPDVGDSMQLFTTRMHAMTNRTYTTIKTGRIMGVSCLRNDGIIVTLPDRIALHVIRDSQVSEQTSLRLPISVSTIRAVTWSNVTHKHKQDQRRPELVHAICDDGGFRAWDTRTGVDAVWTMQMARTPLDDTAVCARGASNGLMTIALDDGSISVWDERNGHSPIQVAWCEGHVGAGTDYFYFGGAADGFMDIGDGWASGLIAAGGGDGMVRVWDACKGGSPIGQMKFDKAIRRVRFVQEDDAAGMWVETREEIHAVTIAHPDGTAVR